MSSPEPPFGRMVRYVSHNGEVLTGIVTGIDPSGENRVNLQLFRDLVSQAHLPQYVHGVDHSPVDPTGKMKSNSWHWPPRG